MQKYVTFQFSDCSVFRATFTTVKVYDLKSHKNFVLKTIHFTTCFGYTEPSSDELNLLVETAVLFALGMVPASYIFCAWGDHLPPLCCLTYMKLLFDWNIQLFEIKKGVFQTLWPPRLVSSAQLVLKFQTPWVLFMVTVHDEMKYRSSSFLRNTEGLPDQSACPHETARFRSARCVVTLSRAGADFCTGGLISVYRHLLIRAR
jgi:hypothetical protein